MRKIICYDKSDTIIGVVMHRDRMPPHTTRAVPMDRVTCFKEATELAQECNEAFPGASFAATYHEHGGYDIAIQPKVGQPVSEKRAGRYKPIGHIEAIDDMLQWIQTDNGTVWQQQGEALCWRRGEALLVFGHRAPTGELLERDQSH